MASNVITQQRLKDGDKGDITVTANGGTWTIDNDVVTYAKMQNVSATDKVLGRSTAGSGDVEEITCTAAGRALLDDANAAAQLVTLGINSSAAEVNITDGGETTEKVLNVQSKCRAYLNGTQSNLTDNTPTKVLLDTELYDVGGDFDTANSRFVAPVSGYYMVTANIGYTSTVADRRGYVMIYVNGSSYQESVYTFSANLNHVLYSGAVVYCGAGQYIELYARVIAGVNTVDLLSGATVTVMSVHLLSI